MKSKKEEEKETLKKKEKNEKEFLKQKKEDLLKEIEGIKKILNANQSSLNSKKFNLQKNVI
jgi:hypothetical protein